MAGYRITREAIRAYADLSHDRNPLHLDEAVAARSPFGGVVAHGFLLLSGPLSALGASQDYPKTMEFRFRSPGRPGDMLETHAEADGTFKVTCGDRLLVEGRTEG